MAALPNERPLIVDQTYPPPNADNDEDDDDDDDDDDHDDDNEKHPIVRLLMIVDQTWQPSNTFSRTLHFAATCFFQLKKFESKFLHRLALVLTHNFSRLLSNTIRRSSLNQHITSFYFFKANMPV